MTPLEYLPQPTADDLVSLLERKCLKELAKISETTGIWSHEGGLKQAYKDILLTIEVYNEKYGKHGNLGQCLHNRPEAH